MSLLKIENLCMAHGHVPLLDNASLVMERGERLCLVGRNGEGKSTLLQLIGGEQTPDSGRVEIHSSVRIGRLAQEPALQAEHTVFQAVASGLGEVGAAVLRYHQVASEVERNPALLTELEKIQHQLEAMDGWRLEQRAETVISRLGLDADTRVGELSGGRQRRVDLGRVLVQEPDLLLLDEPTNHLDVESIEWLEEWLAQWSGGLIFISHDRDFARKVATRVIALDRGILRNYPGDYANYLRRREEEWAAEDKQAAEFDKKLAQEEAWIRQGVKARRTRNMGRVRALEQLRRERNQRRERKGGAHMALEAGETTGKIVIEALNLSKSFPASRPGAAEKCILRDFSTVIFRGDRIGILGPNGAGKTTLLKILLQQLAPDRGNVHHGTQLEIAYFDQLRAQLDPNATVRDTVGEGRDYITLHGKTTHVMGYLAEFLFPPARALSPVRALSGGERNRLLLARLFSKPANLLVLDEPTNDLDVETLELLEELLSQYPGTLLLVSHDRAFLDAVATSLLVFEEHGKIIEIIGGYREWAHYRDHRPKTAPPPAPKPAAAPAPARAATRKLSYKEQQELAQLPVRIEQWEQELAALRGHSADPAFYRQTPAAITQAMNQISALEQQLEAGFARWAELEN